MARVSTTIATELRRIRQERGMSAQKLADRCGELGAPIPRTVLSNLENGRRGNVTVAELLVLAAALDVPPATLVFPVGRTEEVEVLPNNSVHPLSAIQWLSGGPEGSGSEDVPIYRYRRHAKRAAELEASLGQLSWLKRSASERELQNAKMRSLVVSEQLDRMMEQRNELTARMVEARDSSLMEDLLRVEQEVEALQRELAQARANETRAVAEVTMTRSYRDRVRELAKEIRDDRSDMEHRGWILPELSEKLRKIVETGEIESLSHER